jgi:hypothetical protein
MVHGGCGKGCDSPQPYATKAGASRASREGFSGLPQTSRNHMKNKGILCARQSVPGQMWKAWKNKKAPDWNCPTLCNSWQILHLQDACISP